MKYNEIVLALLEMLPARNKEYDDAMKVVGEETDQFVTRLIGGCGTEAQRTKEEAKFYLGLAKGIADQLAAVTNLLIRAGIITEGSVQEVDDAIEQYRNKVKQELEAE